MSKPQRFSPGEWYHCYNRGIDMRQVFMEHRDYLRFQMLLYTCNNRMSLPLRNLLDEDAKFRAVFEQLRDECLVDIGAYALMPTHYHLLLRERVEGGISLFMRKLGTAYIMYFNAKYRRAGTLFSGRFKARHIEKAGHLKRVVNYIHGNPSQLFEEGKKGEVYRNIVAYPFASLHDYEDVRRAEGSILSSSLLEGLLDDTPSVEGAVEDFHTLYARTNQRLWVGG